MSKIPRDGGRGCGCDPIENHPCDAHASYHDDTETEAATGYSYDSSRPGADPKQPLIVVVTGPDKDGEIGILAADSFYLTRFEAEDLALEILRRLAPRGK